MSDITRMITVNVFPSPKGRWYSLTSAYLFVGQTEDGRHYNDISLTWLHQLMRVLDEKNYKDMSVSLVTVLSLLFKSPAPSWLLLISLTLRTHSNICILSVTPPFLTKKENELQVFGYSFLFPSLHFNFLRINGSFSVSFRARLLCWILFLTYFINLILTKQNSLSQFSFCSRKYKAFTEGFEQYKFTVPNLILNRIEM